jgi:RNA polymerase sigma-70 factor (ECF subfamily)
VTRIEPEDAALVRAVVRGDAAAARELYERHGRAILRFGLTMTNRIETAEDIVHDTFLQLLRRPGQFDPTRGSLRAYLYGIARHETARHQRTTLPTAREADREDEALAAQGPAQAGPRYLQDSLDEHADRVRDIERTRAAIRALPFTYREVIAWCDLEELPYADVAGILGCPIGTVRSRLHRARALLAAALRDGRGTMCGATERPDGRSPTERCALGPTSTLRGTST